MTDAYKDTVFLPTTDFPMRGDLPKREPGFLQYWQDIRLYETLRADRAGQTRYVLHDGPPYANGNIHIGHAVNKILKDVVARSQWLLGKDTAYVPGWDCHGLPIEWKIEEQYRKAGKDKDQVPVLQFRAECRNFAEHWVSVQAGEFQRLGVMGDWADPYTTMTRAAEARIVGEIHKFLLNGRLYKGMKPVMWSIVEKTALAEAEIEYHDHTSPTIYVGFPITAAKNAAALIGAEAIIWTTTPWTIPGNRAIAYGEDLDYGVYAAPDGRRLLIAAALRESVMAALGISELTELAALKGAQLKGAEARHPLHAVGGIFADAIPLLAGDFVTTEAGTGLVHIAPGHGEDDFNLYRAHTGSVRDEWYFNVLTDDGAYQPHIPSFAGKRVQRPDGKSGDANKAVIEALAAAGHLCGQGKINHSYPHSWRSKAPVIFRTTPQWFIALDDAPAGQDALRALALKAIGETRWIPAVGENRIRGMIETRPDWCISRQRAWGVPIAIFVDKKTGKPLADPAVCARVVEAFRKDGADAWYARPPQEFLGDAYRAEDYQAVFDIVDVWFESGSTHAFVLEDRKDQHWPADLYLEGSDQHRGWFHSSLLESCGTRGHAPYRAVLTHGFVLDEQGRKMSKSLGNVVAPQDVIQQYGADILRLFVLATDYGDDIRVGPETLKHQTELYRRLRNTLRYLLGALNGYSDAETVALADLPELERFMLHRLHAVDAGIRKAIDDYAFNRMLTELHHFCAVDVSAFYFDVRKDSLYCDPASSLRRRAVRTVMHFLFEHLVRWLAPILCFTAEEAFLTRHGGMDKAAKRSVHRETFLPVPAAWQDAALAEKWERLRDLRRVVTGAIELARNDKKIGASLQAHPEIFVDAGTASLLAAAPFADICITSDVTVTVAEPASLPPADAFRLADLPEVGVKIHLAKGEKCARCWRVLPEVGEERTHAALCRRCVSAVAPDKAA